MLIQKISIQDSINRKPCSHFYFFFTKNTHMLIYTCFIYITYIHIQLKLYQSYNFYPVYTVCKMFYSLNIILRTFALRIDFFILATPKIFFELNRCGYQKENWRWWRRQIGGKPVITVFQERANKGQSQGNGKGELRWVRTQSC